MTTETMRQLWDGGYLRNTPLRELLTAHRNYWMECLRNNREVRDEKKLHRHRSLKYILSTCILWNQRISQKRK